MTKSGVTAKEGDPSRGCFTRCELVIKAKLTITV